MCLTDDEGCEVWNETERTARKPHKCGECEGRISVGERYLYVFGVHEREAFTHHVCACCDFLWFALFEAICNGEGASMAVGLLRSELESHAHADEPLAGELLAIYRENAEGRAAA